MPDHIAIGIVADDEIVLVGTDGFYEFVCDFVSAHLRFQIICSHLGRRYENPVFAFERLLTASVEEERHMRVFLRFGYMQLFQ